MTIQVRLALTISALLTATLCGAFGIFALSERANLRRERERAHLSLLSKAANVSAESVLNRNEVLLLSYLRSLKDVPELRFAAFMDETGEVRGHTDPTLLGKRLDDELDRRAAASSGAVRREAGGVIEWAMPVSAKGRRLGTARIALDERILDEALSGFLRSSLRRFLPVLGVSLAVGVAGAALLARGFTAPIQELIRGARAVGGGDLGSRVALKREDELGFLAEEFDKMTTRLGELDALKESFLAKITHDLRNPLSVLLGHVELMSGGAGGPVTPKQTASLGVMLKSIAYLGELIENILDLTRLEAGKMPLDLKPVPLGGAAIAVTELLRVRAEEYGVDLKVEVPEAATVRADAHCLQRVLVNLAGNALKFTPKGGSVTIGWRRDGAGADEISVRDTGIGIPADKVPLLFRKFSQVDEDQNRVRPARGTGLGLAIAREIVEAHGGRIWIESKVGQGSTFLFTLPAAAAVPARAEAAA